MKLQKFDEEDVITLYKSGRTLKEISIKYGRPNRVVAIKNILNANNIPITNKYGRNRSRYVDENIFDVIDTKEKSYLLGLICSDGSIDNDGYSFTFVSKDEDLVKIFKTLMKSDHKICKIESHDKRTDKIYTRYTIHICSKKIVQSLSKLGISNNKSFTCPMPCISSELFWHFFRGLFDGDGCVSKEKSQKEGRLRFGLVGSTLMINELKMILDKYNLSNTKISKTKYKNEHGSLSSILYYSYNDLKILYDNIYLDSEGIRLNRKYDLFSTLRKYEVGKYDRCKLKNVVQKDLDGKVINMFKNKFEASKILFIGERLIQRVLNKGRKHTHGYIFEYVI